MSRNQLLAGAAPLVAAVPSRASASDVIGMWGGADAGVIAVLGIAAAIAWHQAVIHRAELAERWRQAGAQLRHALAYARAHAHLPQRR